MTDTPEPPVPMGPFLQARLWARTAPTSERAFAAVVAVLVAALIAWSLVPASGDGSALAVGGDVGAQVSLDEGSLAGGVGAGESGGSRTPGSDLGGAPSASGSGSTGGTGTSGRSITTVAGAVGRSGGAGGSAASGPRTASDRGVTADAVKVGFVTLNLGGLEAAGFAAGLRSDIRAVIDAFVDHANSEGGIEGRTIEPVVKSVDLISEDDQRRKCLEFTQSDEVFTVVDSVGFLTEPTKSCVSVENQTPLYTAIPGSSREMAKAAPFQISPRKDHTRAVRDYVAAAVADGFFDRAEGFRRLGLVTDECELDTLADLKAALSAAGIRDVSEYRVPCDIVAQRSVGTPAVLQHQRDGVTHVFFGIANPAVANYTDVAANAGFRPKIFVSDWWTLSTDQSSQDFNDAVFDGARGVTSTVDGDAVVGRPLPELTNRCSDVLVAAGIPPITGSPEDIEVVILCEHLDLFLKMARNVGTNLTRRGMTERIDQVGIFRGSTVFESRFTTLGKFSGGDKIKVSQWRASCSCWHAVTDYRDAYA